MLIRYRAEDFRPIRHMGGSTPGWSVTYEEFEPWYQAAEDLYQVRGDARQDVTEPFHSGAYPHPPVPDEPAIADLRGRLTRAGMHPASLPLGVDIKRWLASGATPWDAFPETCGGKMDAETVGLAKALSHETVSLLTGARASRLLAGAGGRIAAVEFTRLGTLQRMSAPLVVLAAGAVNSEIGRAHV